MTTELKNKWAEIIEFSFNIGWNIQKNNVKTFADLSQTEKNRIFNTVIDGVLKDSLSVDRLRTFVRYSKIDTKIDLNCNFDSSIAKHEYNIRGTFNYILYSVLYNWPELFNRMVIEINDYIIPHQATNKDLIDEGLSLSFESFTKEEVKEFAKYLIDEVSYQPDFIDIYTKIIKPNKL